MPDAEGGEKTPKKARIETPLAAATGAVTIPAASGAASAASGAGKTVTSTDSSSPETLKSLLLDLPPIAPPRPQAPSEGDITSGQAVELKIHMKELYGSILYRLSLYLYDNPDVKLRTPLHTQKCPIRTDRQMDARTGARTDGRSGAKWSGAKRTEDRQTD